MSIITTVEAIPNRIEQMWLYMIKQKDVGLDRKSLAHIFSPPSLTEIKDKDDQGEAGGNIFDGVFKESIALGLLTKKKARDGKEVYVIGVRPSKDIGDLTKAKGWLLDYLTILITTPDKAQKAKQKNLPFALAWMLLLNPAKPLKMGENHVDLIQRDFPKADKAFDVNLLARFDNLFYWARYLGLCTFVGLGSDRLIVPDPTKAVSRILPKLFEKDKKLTAIEFTQRLGNACPVLDMGIVQKKLEALAAESANLPKDGELSMSTSLAIQRLETKGIIHLEEVSDSQTMVLKDIDRDSRRFTHVQFVGAKHAI